MRDCARPSFPVGFPSVSCSHSVDAGLTCGNQENMYHESRHIDCITLVFIHVHYSKNMWLKINNYCIIFIFLHHTSKFTECMKYT